MLIQVLYLVGILQGVSDIISPLTVVWLGLPAIAGILLIFGFIRKELTLLAAVAIFGSNLALAFSPAALVTIALVNLIYIPCLATVTVIAKDFGWKTAAVMTAANFAVAMLVGGIAIRILSLFL